MSGKLEKLINLIKKTGDRLIIYDPTENLDPYVIMDLEAYQVLLGKKEATLTENGLSDTISRDVQSWQELNNIVQSKPNINKLDLLETESAEDQAEELEDETTELVNESSFETLLESVLVETESEAIVDGNELNMETKIASVPFTDVGSILERRAQDLSAGKWHPGSDVRRFSRQYNNNN